MLIALTILAYRIKAVDVYGAFAPVPIGFITLSFGGVSWFLALLSFFLLASYFTKHKYKQKEFAGFRKKTGELEAGPVSWLTEVYLLYLQ